MTPEQQQSHMCALTDYKSTLAPKWAARLQKKLDTYQSKYKLQQIQADTTQIRDDTREMRSGIRTLVACAHGAIPDRIDGQDHMQRRNQLLSTIRTCQNEVNVLNKNMKQESMELNFIALDAAGARTSEDLKQKAAAMTQLAKEAAKQEAKERKAAALEESRPKKEAFHTHLPVDPCKPIPGTPA